MTNTAMVDASMSSRAAKSCDAAAAGWLALAAAPTFAAMALWTASRGQEPMCAMGSSPLGGMTFMYALMSAFHLAPWLGWLGRATSRLQAGVERP